MWKIGDFPSTNVGITHPGVCEPLDSPQCRGRNDFVSCEVEGFDSCDAIKRSDAQSLDLTFRRTAIPATETNYYCQTFDLPADQDYHIIANEPLIDNENVVHHMLIYGCDNPNGARIDQPQPCGMSVDEDCSTIIALWTVGVPGTCYGDNIGFRIGRTAYRRVKLETHYNNPNLVKDYTDASGLRLYYQPAKPGVEDLVTFNTGQAQLVIPPGQSRVEQIGVCRGDCTRTLFKEPVYLFAALNHMHYLGRSMKIELFRNGVLIKELTNDEFYSYDSPVNYIYEPPVQILPGDEIKTSCVFNSLSSKRYVYWGEGTSDEMCFGLLTMYPKQAITIPDCVSFGPFSACDFYSGTPYRGCDWKTFINMSHPTTLSLLGDLRKNCNLDGFCRPECLDILEGWKDHPCLQDDLVTSMKTLIAQSSDGVEFLARIHSCPMYHSATEPQYCNAAECSQWCGEGSSEENVYDGAPETAATSIALVTITTIFAIFV